jgi:hypothetical protein
MRFQLKKIENTVHKLLKHHPKFRNRVYTIYQLIFSTIYREKSYKKNIKKLSPSDKYQYYFGYYDKSPWDIDDENVLCLQVEKLNNVAPIHKSAKIVVFNMRGDSKQVIGETKAYNAQQGCMLQWLSPEYKNIIFYNDFNNNDFVGVIYNIITQEKKIINRPLYTISKSGKFGYSIDFSRLHLLRPGYGYNNKKLKLKNVNKIPSGFAIEYVDIAKNVSKGIINFKDLLDIKFKKSMNNSYHWVNHIIISPNNKNFIFMHRWMVKNEIFSRLLLTDKLGKKLKILSDFDFVSHYNWIDNTKIIVYLNNPNQGKKYYIIDIIDNSTEYVSWLPDVDGHPSYGNGLYLTDTYPNRKRMQKIYLGNSEKLTVLCNLKSPIKFSGDLRCDLHPRFNHDYSKISFDSTMNGKRELFYIDLKEQINE